MALKRERERYTKRVHESPVFVKLSPICLPKDRQALLHETEENKIYLLIIAFLLHHLPNMFVLLNCNTSREWKNPQDIQQSARHDKVN